MNHCTTIKTVIHIGCVYTRYSVVTSSEELLAADDAEKEVTFLRNVATDRLHIPSG